MDAMIDKDRTRSGVYGAESALAERAVILMSKLCRSTIHPYVVSGFSSNGVGAFAALAQNAVTPLDPERFRNDQDGAFVITRSRCFTVTNAVTSANPGAVFSNVSLQVSDVEGNDVLGRAPALLPTLHSRESGTMVLSRPYVMGRRSALLVRATEENVNGTTLLFVSFMGEVVLGPMSDREVREAVMLGIYPLPGRQSGVWDHTFLMGRLFGRRPPKLKGEADDLLYDLRDKALVLREKLRAADCSAYVVEDGRSNLVRDTDTAMNRDSLRNDQKGPFAVTRAAIHCDTAFTGNSGPFSNVALRVEGVDEPLRLTRDFVEAPLLFNIATNMWLFDHPHVVAPRGGLGIALREHDIDATTDVHLALHGEVVRGVTSRELRQAVALGMYPLIDRNQD